MRKIQQMTGPLLKVNTGNKIVEIGVMNRWEKIIHLNLNREGDITRLSPINIFLLFF